MSAFQIKYINGELKVYQIPMQTGCSMIKKKKKKSICRYLTRGKDSKIVNSKEDTQLKKDMICDEFLICRWVLAVVS